METDLLKGKQILITDDDYTCYRYIHAVLEKTGADFHWANNGLNAVDFIKSNPSVDLIFMDLSMPIMGGKQAIEHIHSINKNIPIIIQSGAINEFDTFNKLHGYFEFLEKPFKPNQVYTAVKNILKIDPLIQ